MPSRDLSVSLEQFPIAGHFTISRGSRTEAHVVVATIRQGASLGRGECVPYARYGESLDSVAAQIEAMLDPIDNGMTREELRGAMPPGAARNAIDCAMWDLEAKLSGKRVWQMAGLDEPDPLVTLYTISLDTPSAMAEVARNCGRSHLKIKLGGEHDADRLTLIREAAPDATIVIDANEGWGESGLEAMLALCARHGVAMIEQPLPAGKDEMLRQIAHPVPICADESVHDLKSLPDPHRQI